MATNARALWAALPDGALKRQLLAELAQLAQLDARDLADLWSHSAPPAPTRTPAPGHEPAPWEHGAPPAFAGNFTPRTAGGPSQGSRGTWKNRGAKAWTPPYQGPRPSPVSRADQAARLLLSHMAFLEELTHDDHDALSAQPAPHGPLFAWLEQEWHEHGPQPWAVLRESLRGQGCESLAALLMSGPHAQPEGDLQEIRRELRGVLNRMRMDRIKQQETEAVAALRTDPTAAQRLRALQAQRLELEALARKAS